MVKGDLMLGKEISQVIRDISKAKDDWLRKALLLHGVELSDKPDLNEFKQYKGRIELRMIPKCSDLYLDGQLIGKWFDAEFNNDNYSMVSYTNKYWIKNSDITQQ